MSCYFTKNFVYLLIIAAVSNFSYFKFIGWDAGNIYLFKFNSRNTRIKMWNILKVNSKERRFGVFTVNLEHISHVFLVLLLFTMNR